MRHPHNNESGMTLLELMFAAGVLGMALTLLFGSLLTISAVGGMAEGRGIAVTHLASVMEQLRALNYNEMLAYQPPGFTALGATEQVKVECFKDDGTTVQLPVAPGSLPTPLPNPARARCTISWYDQRGHALSLNASQLFYR
jgi:type II secretory pathway pseudopilin PulG